jgi:Secretion system C-terminal sorting domain
MEPLLFLGHMKKIVLIAIVSIGFGAMAQTTFVVNKKNSTATVTPNSIIDAVTTPTDLTTNTFDVYNSSASTHTYNVKRYDLFLHKTTAVDTAEARFCFAGQCYLSTTYLGLVELVLPSVTSTSTLGDYFSLDCDLAEAGNIGYSLVKYTIFNVNTPSDSMQFTMRYNAALQFVGIKEQAASALKTSFAPNPAKEHTQFVVTATAASVGSLQVINSIGQVVISQKLEIIAGKNTYPVNLAGLAAGVYFAQLNEGGKTTTQKLIVE